MTTPRTRTAPVLDENGYQPIMWGPMRAADWIRYGIKGVRHSIVPIAVASVAFMGFKAFNATGSDKIKTQKVARVQQLSQLKFNMPYEYGQNSTLDKLVDQDSSRAVILASMSENYKKDTLTDVQIYQARVNTASYITAARDMALEDLKNELSGFTLAPRKITSHFGMRFHPKKHVWKKHDGVDLKGAAGDPITSTDHLTFVSAKGTGLKNFTVYLGDVQTPQNGDIMFKGLHSKAINGLKKGDPIPPGTVFAHVGKKDAYSTGPHLHLQAYVMKNGKWAEVNPEIYAEKFRSTSGLQKTNENMDSRLLTQLMQANNAAVFDSIGASIADNELKIAFKKIQKKVDAAVNPLIREMIQQENLASYVDFNSNGKIPTVNFGSITAMNNSIVDRDRSAANKTEKKSKTQQNSFDFNETSSDQNTAEVKQRYKVVPKNVLHDLIVQDQYMQQFAAETQRPIEDVANVFVKIAARESSMDPDVVAKSYKDKNGKWHKRTAAGLFGMVQGTRNTAAKQIGMRWPSQKNLGTLAGIKTQIAIAGKLAVVSHQQLNQLSAQHQRKTGQNLINRVYIDKSSGQPRWESGFAATVNAWGPGVGGYIALRKKEVNAHVNAKTVAPVMSNVVFASGQMQSFNKGNSFVTATALEMQSLQKVAPIGKQAVTYSYVPAAKTTEKKQKSVAKTIVYKINADTVSVASRQVDDNAAAPVVTHVADSSTYAAPTISAPVYKYKLY